LVPGSQHPVEAQGGEPPVQHGSPVRPHVVSVEIVPPHARYSATESAQFAVMAVRVAESSVTPSGVHFSCLSAQSK
jgi:hypothetical protein